MKTNERLHEWMIAAIFFVVAVVFVILAIFSVKSARAQLSEGSNTPTVEMPQEMPQKPVLVAVEKLEPPEPNTDHVPAVTEEPSEAIPDINEAELIEAALVAQGYFRDDIPLSYDEQDLLHAACDEFQVDYYIMLALIERETNFRNIPGDGGASIGYCQIQPKWWSGLMEEIGAEDLEDPYDNFRTACAIVDLLTELHGDLENALTAYNRGKPGESKYATAILTNAEKWRGE